MKTSVDVYLAVLVGVPYPL